MQHVSDTIDIAAGRERIWRALCLPAEVIRWDTGVIAPLDAPTDYPRPGQHVRWRYRLGSLPLLLHDRPIQVEHAELLRSAIRLGPFDFDETYTLQERDASTTRLTAALSVSSHVPLLGGLLERILGWPLARATVHESLLALKQHCERSP
jgi:hypothetical protein